jgi:hypothetical protein
MVVLAVMAAGVHSMSIAAPALAEQERQARNAEAAAERSVVSNPAATEGLPVPALLGGIVLAFAVGLSAGQVQRRRRAVRRTATARVRPAPAPTPPLPARPAPPPPEPVTAAPKPVELAPAEPPAPPPPPPAPIRSHGPRILRFRPAPPPPPEHDEVAAEPAPREVDEGLTAHEIIEEAAAGEAVSEPAVDEIGAEASHEIVEEPADEIAEEPADEIAEAPTAEPIEEPADEAVEDPADEIAEAPTAEPIEEPEAEIVDEPVIRGFREPEPAAALPLADEPAAGPAGPLGVAPELPQRDASPPSPVTPATPLPETPEALRAGRLEAQPVVPARRFARARPWPADAETLWTCEIAWKAGYLKSTFRAMAGPPGAGRRKSIAESPSLRWTLMTDPEPPTPEMIASVKVLVSALVAAGWEHAGAGVPWYAQRFIWRGSGEPAAVAVPDEVESAEPPSR